MYSAVLVLALTAGSDTVDFGRNRCGGNGCSGYGYGCSGAVAYGCAGSGHHGGGYGCAASYGCNNGYGCANSCGGRRGLFGGGHHNRGGGCCNTVCSNGYYGGVGAYGCAGGYGCSGGVIYQGGGYGTPVGPKTMPKSEPIPDPKKKDEKKPVAAPATIVVTLPAEARLFVDGSATSSTSERRTLITPELQFGSTYVYTMRAEVVRDGQVVTETQHVNVVGGQIANVRFNFSQTIASR
jgi:uncharacterized protein (TIGR03000 family)